MPSLLIRTMVLFAVLALAPSGPSNAQPGPPGSGDYVTCTLSTSGIDFGIYDPLDPAPADFDGMVEVSCSLLPTPAAANLAYSLTLSTGNSGQFGARTLQSVGGALDYNIYLDAARFEVWGDGSAESGVASGEMRLRRNPPDDVQHNVHTAYGRIPALQNPAVGQYADALIVTLEF
jgi:spore coat protein U-like protein